MSELAALLDKWQGEQIDFLARFVNQDSGTDDRDDVNKAGDLLVEALDNLHFDVTRLPQDSFGDHIVGVKPGSGSETHPLRRSLRHGLLLRHRARAAVPHRRRPRVRPRGL